MTQENQNKDQPKEPMQPAGRAVPRETNPPCGNCYKDHEGRTLCRQEDLGGARFMKKYQIIYADPPWRYDFSKSDSREVENQYPTMLVEEICALKVPSDDNAVLYLWATAPKLFEALQVMKAWGFQYKTHAIWDKEMIGMGYWFRGQHELLLIGTKGKISPPNPKERVPSIYKERRKKHSQKPLYFKGLIVDSFPADWNRLEMFARPEENTFKFGEYRKSERSPSWDYWGNEVKSDIEL